MKKNHWYDYLWIWAIVYFALGFFNIIFAWLGLIDFLLPLIFAAAGGSKFFCNSLCGRGQLLGKLGGDCKLSRGKPSPRWFSSKGFRYGFLKKAIKLFWTLRVPWDWAYAAGSLPAWAAQFSFGFYSLMLTSTLIGLIVMVLYRPRSWCAFCPMGTMTQSICKLKNRAG